MIEKDNVLADYLRDHLSGEVLGVRAIATSWRPKKTELSFLAKDDNANK